MVYTKRSRILFLAMRKHFNAAATLKKLIFPLAALTALILPSTAESFRVAKTHIIEIPQNYEPVSTQSGIFDGIAIKLPQDKTFITGIEISIKVPQTVAAWRDTVAYMFYGSLSPVPDSARIDYQGEKLSVDTIPGRLSHTVYVPLTRKFNVKSTPYAKTLDVIPSAQGGTVFMRFTLAMKGAPETLESAVLEVSARPVLSDEGYFTLDIQKPEGKDGDYSVYIDDTPATDTEKAVLKDGEHRLSITSEAFRNEVRTFIVEQAKLTRIKVELRGIEPLIRIVSPENAAITLDGESVEPSNGPFEVSSGAHIVKFVIGDYEIVKTVNAVNGRSYTVRLEVDATVTEEE